MSSDNVLLLNEASLTIKEDSLVIADKRGSAKKQKGARQGCCGAILDGSAKDSSDRTILLYNVLWAEAEDNTISINIARTVNATKLEPETITYKYSAEEEADVKQWIARMLSQAYGDAQTQKRFKVLINPFGGPGKARKIYTTYVEGLLQAARCQLDVTYTTHHEHAIELAETMDIEQFDAVLCVSGDGVVHEIFNGFARRQDATRALRKIAVCQLAGGTGNAMCWNLTGTGNASYGTLAIIKGVRSSMDLVSISQGDKRYISFLSQAVGIVAEVDLGTEDMRWMGSTRFTVGFLQRILREAIYPCDVAFKVVAEDKDEIRKIYRENNTPAGSSAEDGGDEGGPLPASRFGTVNDPVPDDWTSVHLPHLGNFFAGNMAIVSEKTNFFPASRPNDGMMDLICISGTIGRMKAVELLLAVETGKHFNSDSVAYRKIQGYRITPRDQKDGYISIDGEKVPFEPFQAEILPGLATVLSKRPNAFEAAGVA